MHVIRHTFCFNYFNSFSFAKHTKNISYICLIFKWPFRFTIFSNTKRVSYSTRTPFLISYNCFNCSIFPFCIALIFLKYSFRSYPTIFSRDSTLRYSSFNSFSSVTSSMGAPSISRYTARTPLLRTPSVPGLA